MVARLLLEGNLHLGHFVAEVVLVVVEVLLEEVEEHCDMRAAVDVLQLVAGEFGDDGAVLAEFVEDVKERYADVAREDAAGQEVMDEAGGGRLTFGASDTDGHVAVDLKEEVGEGC